MTTICIDLGNTRWKAAVFNNSMPEEIILQSPSQLENLLSNDEHVRVMMCSVVNHSEEWQTVIQRKTDAFHLLTTTSSFNFSMDVQHPETVGADRLALLAGAIESYPHQNNLVIAMGSCITYSFIDNEHVFRGGAISPGMDMRFRAMHEFTAKLPAASFVHEPPITAKDTVSNLQSGVINGIIGELDHFISKYSEKYGNLNVILTGGDASYFAERLKSRIFADQQLLFKGLYALSKINFENT